MQYSVNNRFGIVSITPPNIPRSSYINRQIKIKPDSFAEPIVIPQKSNDVISKNKTTTLNNAVSSQIPEVYVNSKFNWIHYLILNYDVFIKDNIDTAQKAFEHWVKKGMREKRRSIMYEDEMLENLQIYKIFKKKLNFEFLDEKMEQMETKMKSKLNDRERYLFNKCHNLFHKYLLHLRAPNSNLTYSVLKKQTIKQKYICAIHCYDLKYFVKQIGEYLNKITQIFDVIVTYIIDNDDVRNSYNFTFILMQDIGSEVGGKFVAVDYLKSSTIIYEYMFFFNSNINKTQKKNHVDLFISKLETIQCFFKHDKALGGVFPDTISIGSYSLKFISNKLESIINSEKYELINWETNSLYMSELQNYLGIDNESFIFSNSNYYILHKSVVEMIFGDKNLYNILNEETSFDYNWVNLQYKVDADYETVYRQYKINKWFGNAYEARLGVRCMEEAMIENVFDKIVMSAVSSRKKKIKIIGNSDINMSTEEYINDFTIEKTCASDFYYLKKQFINSNDKFDWEIYLLLNKDLEKNGIVTEENALVHWYNFGKKESRLHYDPNFNWEIYLLLNQDLTNSGINTKKEAYIHWINYGKKEKRVFNLFLKFMSIAE